MAVRLKDPAKAERYNIAANTWVARIIPVLLAATVGYATYVLVVELCVHYLIIKHDDATAAIAILVVYFVLFLLVAISFFRLVYITIFDPPLVPLGPSAIHDRKAESRGEKDKPLENGIGGAEYDSGNGSRGTTRDGPGSPNDPDSPGLELFYTKDVFVCEIDGKPRWCSHCKNWKPDRAHHCSTSGRCVLKMDHFCPWVGGPVGESNMKFFIQFNFYTALYCTHLLIVMASYIKRQRSTKGESINTQMAVILGLAAFFFLFTAGMAGSSFELAMKNQTQVENVAAKTRIHFIAVIKPCQEELHTINPQLASQPPYAEITYPLEAGVPPPLDTAQKHGVPRIKSNLHARMWHSFPVASRPESTAQNVNQSIIGPSSLPSIVRHADTVGDTPPTQNQSISQAEGTNESLNAGFSLISGTQFVATSASEGLSERDRRATRTFAILSMREVGKNPWDLGSRLLNLQTVMGTNVFDWLLPIRRSPCCNHEGTESQFAVGPNVNFVRREAGLIDQTPQVYRRRKRKHRRDKSGKDGGQLPDRTNGLVTSSDIEMNRYKAADHRTTGMDDSVDTGVGST